MELAFGLLIFGFMFVVAEIFFPSFGLLSVLAAGCFIGSVAFAFRHSSTTGFVFVGGIVVSLPVVIVAGFRILPKTGIGKKLILSGPTPREDGDSVGSVSYQDVLRRTGVTTTPLRPAGIAEIDGRRVDVVADGEMIPAGEEIRVIKVEGNRIVVERAADFPVDEVIDPDVGESQSGIHAD